MTKDDAMSVKGRIFNIQYFCIHDGPGIRTTVFLKGCPLNCLWCHNPEGISFDRLLSFSENKCIHCGACARVCSAHRIECGRHVLDRAGCKNEFLCTSVCPGQALSIVGSDVTVSDVLKEAVRDRKFYETSGGGVTFSGGEPTMQPGFLIALLSASKAEGLHTAVETGGSCTYSVLQALLPFTDLFLYDWKETDPIKHKQFTGVSNNLIRQNLIALHEVGAPILLRCPIICGLNDRDDHFQGIADLFSRLPNLIGVEVLAYHQLAASKSIRMGLKSQQVYDTPSAELKSTWDEKLTSLGVRVIES